MRWASGTPDAIERQFSAINLNLAKNFFRFTVSAGAIAKIDAGKREPTSNAGIRGANYAKRRQRAIRLQIPQRQSGGSDQFEELCLQLFHPIMPQKPLMLR